MKWYRYDNKARPQAVFGATCDKHGRFAPEGVSRIIRSGAVVQLDAKTAKAVQDNYPGSLVEVSAPADLPEAVRENPAEPFEQLSYRDRYRVAKKLGYDGGSRADADVTAWLHGQHADDIADAIADLAEGDDPEVEDPEAGGDPDAG